MDSGGNSVAESVGESPEPEQAARPAGKPSKGRGLRRWRRIPREHHHDGQGSPASPGAGAAASGSGVGPGEDLSQLHKRRLALAAGAPKGKEDAAVEEESSVESRFVPPPPPPEVSTLPAATSLDPNLGHLIATAGFSVGAGGADSENSDDWNSKSSTAASAPRHDFSFGGFGRDRERARSRVPGGAAHGKNLRAARVRGGASARAATSPASPVEPENSRSSVESNLRGSSTAQPRESCGSINSNGVHKVLFSDDHHSDEEAPSEEVRYSTGGFHKQNGSVVGRFVMGNYDSDASDRIFEEASVGKFENGGTRPGLDPYVESIALLQTAQEALENEIQRFVEIRKETDENSTTHSEEYIEEESEKLQGLQLKLEQATVLINEEDSKILELSALNQARQETCKSNLLTLQSDTMEQLLLEKMEAEVQCFILTRASEAWNQVASCEMQKYLPGDPKSIETKLRHSENRAMMLEEMVDRLEAQCKELSEASEVLKLHAKTSKTSLFCSIQLLLVCIALGTLFMRFLPSSTEIVPT